MTTDLRSLPPTRSRTAALAVLEEAPRPRGRYVRVVKPAFDRVVATVLLVTLLPVMVLCAIAVAASVGAPVLYLQQRVGRDGRTFRVLKFRTMHADRRRDVASSVSRSAGYDGPDRRRTHKSADDPRLTPTGRLLRKLSLDELPQLLNVIRGDMSLVGPRPELPSVVDAHYEAWMHRRHAVKPGMTGLWQISERGNGMMHEHVDVDLDYVDQISIGTDLRILARTLPAALGSHKGH